MNTSLMVVAAAVLAVTSNATMAQPDFNAAPIAYGTQRTDGGSPQVYAEVISSAPDYRQVKINVPGQQVCHDEVVVGSTTGNQQVPAGQTRCETQYDSHFEQRQVGFDVRYRYGGEVYHTHLVRDPGPRLAVDVSVTPAATAGPTY